MGFSMKISQHTNKPDNNQYNDNTPDPNVVDCGSFSKENDQKLDENEKNDNLRDKNTVVQPPPTMVFPIPFPPEPEAPCLDQLSNKAKQYIKDSTTATSAEIKQEVHEFREKLITYNEWINSINLLESMRCMINTNKAINHPSNISKETSLHLTNMEHNLQKEAKWLRKLSKKQQQQQTTNKNTRNKKKHRQKPTPTKEYNNAMDNPHSPGSAEWIIHWIKHDKAHNNTRVRIAQYFESCDYVHNTTYSKIYNNSNNNKRNASNNIINSNTNINDGNSNDNVLPATTTTDVAALKYVNECTNNTIDKNKIITSITNSNYSNNINTTTTTNPPAAADCTPPVDNNHGVNNGDSTNKPSGINTTDNNNNNNSDFDNNNTTFLSVDLKECILDAEITQNKHILDLHNDFAANDDNDHNSNQIDDDATVYDPREDLLAAEIDAVGVKTTTYNTITSDSDSDNDSTAQPPSTTGNGEIVVSASRSITTSSKPTPKRKPAPRTNKHKERKQQTNNGRKNNNTLQRQNRNSSEKLFGAYPAVEATTGIVNRDYKTKINTNETINSPHNHNSTAHISTHSNSFLGERNQHFVNIFASESYNIWHHCLSDYTTMDNVLPSSGYNLDKALNYRCLFSAKQTMAKQIQGAVAAKQAAIDCSISSATPRACGILSVLYDHKIDSTTNTNTAWCTATTLFDGWYIPPAPNIICHSTTSLKKTSLALPECNAHQGILVNSIEGFSAPAKIRHRSVPVLKDGNWRIPPAPNIVGIPYSDTTNTSPSLVMDWSQTTSTNRSEWGLPPVPNSTAYY